MKVRTYSPGMRQAIADRTINCPRYDDDLQLVDLTKMPFVVPVIKHNHQDVLNGRFTCFMDERAARSLL